jgi:hypothetical protein
MKQILFTLFVLCSLTTQAADKKWAMVTQSGETVLMSDVSYLLYADNATAFSIVKKDNSMISEVSKVSFLQVEATGIASVQGAVSEISLLSNVVTDHLTLSGVQSGTKIQIFSISGKQMDESAACGESCQISVADYPNGLYILKVGRTSIKFIKK